MNNIEQVDREAIERDGFATTGGSIGITKRSATAETKRWLENMTAEQREHEFLVPYPTTDLVCRMWDVRERGVLLFFGRGVSLCVCVRERE